MVLEWVVLSYVAAAEATMVLLLTLPPAFNPMRKGLLSVVRSLLKPLLSVLPFCGFLLLDIYWKYDARPRCGGSSCAPTELMRHQKSTIKSQRNALLIAAALMFYWMLHSVTRLALREEQLRDSFKEDTDPNLSLHWD